MREIEGVETETVMQPEFAVSSGEVDREMYRLTRDFAQSGMPALRGVQITRDGQHLALSGHVVSFYQKQLALALAAGQGVQVINRLEVVCHESGECDAGELPTNVWPD